MSIQIEINRISGNVNDTMAVLSDAGVAVPADANSDNLPELVSEAVNAVIPVKRGGTGAMTEYEAANNLGVWSFLGGEAIPANTDLNSLNTPGNYYCASSSTVQTLANCPIDLAFTLKVFYPVGTASYIAHELMDYNTGARYYRLGRASDGTWWDWQTYYMSANKPALDDLSGTLSVNKGGTGAATAAAAANSLCVPTLLSGTSIPANSDLNAYTTVGNYYCPSDSATRSLANCPVDRAFNMRVFYAWGESWAVAQELANGNTGVRYYRWCSKSAGVWTAWQGDYTTANKPTAADVGAPTLAQYNALIARVEALEAGGGV